MLKIVVDTNIWIRTLLGGRITLPVLEAWRDDKFQAVVSEPLLDELDGVWQRPRLRSRINPNHAKALLVQLRWRGLMVELKTIPPHCRDPKDHPVLATAMDGRANAIVSGDADLRADELLRAEMINHGVELWGVDTLLTRLAE